MKTFELPSVEVFYKDEELKQYRIEFYTKEEWNQPQYNPYDLSYTFGKHIELEDYILYGNVDYCGLVSDIPVDLLCLIVDKKPDRNRNSYNYWNYYKGGYCFGTPLESIQSLCELDYCVITKIK